MLCLMCNVSYCACDSSAEKLHEVVCTPPAYNDHTYGFAEWFIVEAQQAALATECKVDSPVDEVYDFGEIYCDSEVSSSDNCDAVSDMESDSSQSPGRRRSWMKLDDDVDEEQRRLEGVRALLNLASGTKLDKTKKRRRLRVNGSLSAKAAGARLKKPRKRLGKMQRQKLTRNKVKNGRKTVIKRRR